MSATVVASYPFLAVTRTTAACRRSRWDRVTSSRGNPCLPRGNRHLRRSSGLPVTFAGPVVVGLCQSRLLYGLVVSAERRLGQVDDLRAQLRQPLRAPRRDLVEDEELRP